MKTKTGQQILNKAAENAGRTRDKVPPSEQVMLQGWIATYLEITWQNMVWPELIRLAAASVPVVNHQFPKNEGQAGELGDILGYYECQPHSIEEEPFFDFSEGDDVVTVTSHAAAVWPVDQIPCPDVDGMPLATFLAATFPQRFMGYLCYMAAGELAKADGNLALAGSNFGLGEKMLSRASSRAWDALPGWLKLARFPRSHRRHFNNQCVTNP